MRKLTLPLILMLALSLTACHHTQAKHGGDTTAAATVAGQKPGQVPDFRSEDQKKKQAIIKAQKQQMINGINDVVGEYERKGIEIRKTPKKHPWRLIDPALAQVSDPSARKVQAEQIANDFKTKIEALMQRKIDVAVYSDTQETQQAN